MRDEADIIEAFVRHNLTVVDGLAIVDHGSSDGTAEILAALAAEGLPLRTTVEGDADFRQSAVITRLAREVFNACDPDYIFLLDADEFLKVPSRARLEPLPPEAHAIESWQSYVPDFADERDTLSLHRHDGVGRTDALALVLRYAERLARQVGGRGAATAKFPG